MRPAIIATLLTVTVVLAIPSALLARAETWTGPDGKEFRGEPAAIHGPVAVFRTGAKTSRRLPLGALSAADCVRFQAAIDALPLRAATWAAAKGSLTHDVVGALYRLENKELARVDFAAVPEPEIVILVFASNNDGASWGALNAINAGYPELRRKAGDAVEAIFVGVGHNAEQHRNMASSTNLAFPLTDYHAQQQMSDVKSFAPGKPPYVVAVTRHGAFLQAATGEKYEDFAKFMTDFAQLATARNPNNPAGWADRLHYLRAVKPTLFKAGTCGPEMLGHPLNLEVLRKHGVRRVDAQFEIAADGKVTAVKVATNDVIDGDFAAILEQALAQSPFVGAVDHGVFVAGSYPFGLDIAP